MLSDMSSLYADLTGQGSLTAAKMAAQDFNPDAHGIKAADEAFRPLKDGNCPLVSAP